MIWKRVICIKTLSSYPTPMVVEGNIYYLCEERNVYDDFTNIGIWSSDKQDYLGTFILDVSEYFEELWLFRQRRIDEILNN